MSEDIRRRTVYLASPLGFAESTAMFMESLVADLRHHVNLLNPWDDHRFDDDFKRAPAITDRNERLSLYRRVNMEIGRSNAASIDASDAIVAILDGVDVD
ncbi:MAG: nucleoside 2-deoxyribosyltransferase, partial [Thermomicrobiales bacterium]